MKSFRQYNEELVIEGVKDLKNYKNSHTKEWAEILGGGDFTIIEEDESETGISTFIKEPE